MRAITSPSTLTAASVTRCRRPIIQASLRLPEAGGQE